ncbi:MAG: cytochrome c [Saprospiraceae bacterium]|nr:cytochrome c [Saprospiraceae bacterium]
MEKISILVLSLIMLIACGGGPQDNGTSDATASAEEGIPKSIVEGKGIGEITEVKLNSPLDEEMTKRGKTISDMKCAACHRYTAQRVVGPGWAGVTTNRKPEWIMNMITNVEVMLEKDPEARALLEECLTRMPNQNLSIGDARDVLEFMYQNDADQAAQ